MSLLVEDSENGTSTFEDLGYDKHDWFPIFEAFDDQEELILEGWPTVTYADQWLFEKENDTGEEVIYFMDDESGSLWLEYSPYRRANEGEMLWGTIDFGGTFRNEYVAEKHEEIMKSHATAYIMPARGYEEELGRISIPEGFNENELEATAQAVISMFKDAQGLQEELKETTKSYEPS